MRVERVARKEGCTEVVNRNLHRDGREVILLTSCVPILDDSGELLGFRGIDKDITTTTQTQESLRRSVVELNALWQIAETVAGPEDLTAALNTVTRQISDALGGPVRAGGDVRRRGRGAPRGRVQRGRHGLV